VSRLTQNRWFRRCSA